MRRRTFQSSSNLFLCRFMALTEPPAPPCWQRRPPLPPQRRPWRSFAELCQEQVGSRPQIPPRPGLGLLPLEPRAPGQPRSTEPVLEDLPGARRCLKKEIRLALRQCSSIQMLDATIAAAKGKLGRSPPEGIALQRLLSALRQQANQAKAGGTRKVGKLISQALRQEESHRRFSLARHGSGKKKDVRGPRKAIFRRSDELASVLQSLEPEVADLEKLIQVAFKQVGRAGRLSKKDLWKALRLCGFKEIRHDWLEEIYEGLTMVSFIGPEDFEKLVREYDQRQRQSYLEAFRRFDVDNSDQISTEELQEARHFSSL